MLQDPSRRSITVLVVDDEEPLAELVRGYLAAEGWHVRVASDGLAAVEVARGSRPDVVVLDVMLPGVDGFEVLRRIRSFSDMYIIMLTARTEELDRLIGLTVGADDYLTKPFSPRELVARIKALLRRPRPTAGVGTGRLGGEGLIIEPLSRTVSLDGRPVDLTALEFDLLVTLATDPGVVVTRQQLLDRVWGVDFVGDAHVVDVHIANVRRKLGEGAHEPRFIETVRGVGYRFRLGEAGQ